MTGIPQRDRRKSLMGVVVSNKMHKTVVVMVERLVRHPTYGKMVRRRAKVKAHDDGNRCKIGDKVLIRETRPLSKDKHWRVVDILEQAAV
jgi:small subunit ribosomal protein S17